MKKYLVQFRPFLVFITVFLCVYILSAIAYRLYLNSFKAAQIDSITSAVGSNVKQLLLIFNQEIDVVKNQSGNWLEVWFNGQYTVRIVEGCNAVSVMILFASFVIAFAGKFKTTLFFILTGIFLLYFFNVLRIALLIVLLYHYPEQQHFLHGVLFPLIIYGLVFLLWIFWIVKFSKYGA